eukprot:g1017.t1
MKNRKEICNEDEGGDVANVKPTFCKKKLAKRKNRKEKSRKKKETKKKKKKDISAETRYGGVLEVPAVSCGLWQFVSMEKKGTFDATRARKAFFAYVSEGYYCFDMADHYGSAELFVGNARAELDDSSSLLVMTKWCPRPGEMDRHVVEQAIEERLRRLQCDSLDLLQFHWWEYQDPRYLDAMKHLTALRAEGKIKNIGVTNFDAAHLRVLLASGFPVVSNQVCLSLLDRRALGDLTKLCLATGVRLFAFGTLCGGLLSDRYLGKPDPTNGDPSRGGTESLCKYLRFVRVVGGWDKLQALLRVLRKIADDLACDIAHVACAWVLRQQAVASVIVGVRLGVSNRAESNKNIERVASGLGPKHFTLLDNVLKTLSTVPGDCGDEYRRPPFLTAAGDLSDHLNDRKRFAGLFRTRGEEGDSKRSVSSGTIWEERYAYSRAVFSRRTGRISIAGTTATHRGFSVGVNAPAVLSSFDVGGSGSVRAPALIGRCSGVPTKQRRKYDDIEGVRQEFSDAYAQAVFTLDKIAASVRCLGGRGLEDVVRTRLIVPNMKRDWLSVASAHGRAFRGVSTPPANTLIGGALVGDAYCVEIEAEAVLQEGIGDERGEGCDDSISGSSDNNKVPRKQSTGGNVFRSHFAVAAAAALVAVGVIALRRARSS